MNQSTENIVLEILRAMRSDITDMKGDMREVRARLGSMEGHMALYHTDVARVSTTMDDIIRRVERLEHRTGLLD